MSALLLASSIVCSCRSPKTSQQVDPTANAGSNSQSAPVASAPGKSSPPHAWRELDVLEIAPRDATGKGEQLIVLLHGWGAQGDDLASLARRLLRANTRFVLPAAPLPEGPGRAWWRLGAGPSYLRAAEDLQAATSVAPNPEIDGSRRHVLNVIRIARQHYEPSSLALVGFSQGGMLALDVALQPASEISRVAVLSGALLNETAPLLQVERSRAPAVLLAHGERDTRVPFEAARTARQALQLQGLPVTWFPFDAGHTISADVVRALSDFLFSPNAASP